MQEAFDVAQGQDSGFKHMPGTYNSDEQSSFVSPHQGK